MIKSIDTLWTEAEKRLACDRQVERDAANAKQQQAQQQIHDMIQTCQVETSENTIARILDILEAINKRLAHLDNREHERQMKEI